SVVGCSMFIPARVFSLACPRALSSPLFPYTTLFRSHGPGRRRRPRPRDGPTSDVGDDARGRWDRSRRGARSGARRPIAALWTPRSEEHTSELQSLAYLVCRLLLEKKNRDGRPTNSDA